MSKITIVSRDDQALLIDIGGCVSFKEAIEQLSSTFLSANQFWQEQAVDLNLGSLLLSKPQAAQIVALVNGVGAKPKQIFARSASTISVLEELQIPVIKGEPETIASITVVDEATENIPTALSTNDEQTEEAAATQKEIKETKIEKIVILNSDLQNDTSETKNTIVPEQNISTTELETSEDLAGKNEIKKEPIEVKKKNSLYLKQTLRAGQAVSHKGDLVIIGDVNAGAEVMAEGDITIWGSLRGIAHAGIDGNTKAEIRALRLQPIQLRIANYIARSPDNRTISSGQNSQMAETAKLVNGKIRILHKTLY
jgi:septum site-determining protein MinC